MPRSLVVLGLLFTTLRAEPPSQWTVGHSPHFTVYSEAGTESARSALLWFESLRAFFLSRTEFKIDDSRQVVVVGFRSAQDYAPYRLNNNVDAFYVGEEGRDYIVLPALSEDDYRLAAHEYAHLAFHSDGLKLPSWLAEGLAEYFSTLDVGERQSAVGGDLPAHAQTLARNAWIPLSKLLAEPHGSTFHVSHQQANLFYAESWLLVDMLVRSPAYADGFRGLLKSIGAGTQSGVALTTIYAKSLNRIAEDLRTWQIARAKAAISLPAVPMGDVAVKISDAPPSAAREIVAQLLLASGDIGRAEALYVDLQHEYPREGDSSAALAAIALMEKDPAKAHMEWQRAMKAGITDPALCLRYAIAADTAGIDADEIRRALRQAIALDPTLDDCRYRLALSEHNAGHWEESLAQLRAMRNIPPQRAFGYWITMASALEALDRREETITAARHAMEHAGSDYQHNLARQLILIAETDMAVQFTRDSEGHEQIETTRIPHNLKNWNPFIEPGETIRRAEGTLSRVQCAGILTGLVVNTPQGELVLKVPDPHRVQLTNAPTQLTCGGDQSAHIRVEYAVPSSVLKGLEFEQ